MPKNLDDIYKKLDQNSKSYQRDNDQLTRAVNMIMTN